LDEFFIDLLGSHRVYHLDRGHLVEHHQLWILRHVVLRLISRLGLERGLMAPHRGLRRVQLLLVLVVVALRRDAVYAVVVSRARFVGRVL
jgi:hypothetical protein